MSFISTSLLVEPLISFDEPDYLPHSDKLYPRRSTKVQISMFSPTQDLMDFDEKSPGDKLYAEIYQKNLQKFRESSCYMNLNKGGPTAGNSSGKRSVNIPSLIDDQVRIDYPSGVSTDKRGKQYTAPYLDPKKSSEHIEKYEKHLEVCITEKEKPLLTLSDTINEPTSYSDDGFSVSAGSSAMAEQRRAQFVHTDPVAVSPIDNVGTTMHAKDSNHALPDVLHKGPEYFPDVIPDGSDYPSDVVPRDSDYLASESSSSRGVMRRPEKCNLSKRSPYITSHSHISREPRRIVKINLPYEILKNMLADPRFDGYCHAWVRRPDFCRHGVNCHFIHDYPKCLVKQFGMVAVYIGPDGKEIKNPEQFLELDEVFVKPKWTKLEQGAMEGSPGCYNSSCRGFIGKDCKFGQKCWYKHPITVVENERWVTKDVRQLVDGGLQTHGPNGEEKVGVGDGFWGDRQSSISHQRLLGSPKLRRNSFRGNSITHILSHKVQRPWKVTEETEKHSLGMVIDSDGVDGGDRRIDPDAIEACYKSNTSYGSRTAQTRSTPVNDLDYESPTALNQSLQSLHIKNVRKPTVAQQKHENTTGDYNYWADESPIEDEYNFWKDAPPPSKVSRLSRHQHALASEAMTYAGLFREDSYKPQEPHNFIMPPQPLGTNWNSEVSRPRQAKKAQSQVVQRGGGMRENLINISTIPGSTLSVKRPGNSCARHESVFDQQSWGDSRGETSASDLDWTKSLKAMLAQKGEPTRWDNIGHEAEGNTLIDI